jgi:NADH-quinone oxidoreductase subunit L
VVTLPLVLLAIPSVLAGFLIGEMLYGDFFGASIFVSPDHPAMAELKQEFHGALPMLLHSVTTLPFWLVVVGIVVPWYLYVVRPDLPGVIREKLGFIVRILDNKYGFDDFNQRVFADGGVGIGKALWKGGDMTIIDGVFVNGSARAVGWFAHVIRRLQTGYIYTYAFTMIIGVVLLLTLWFTSP